MLSTLFLLDELTGCIIVLEGCDFGRERLTSLFMPFSRARSRLGSRSRPVALFPCLSQLGCIVLASNHHVSSRVSCVLSVSRGSAVTEGEVRRCPCRVCTSQSRVGGENSSLCAGRQAGGERPGICLGEQVGEAGTQGHGAGGMVPRYLPGLPTEGIRHWYWTGWFPPPGVLQIPS